MSREPNKNLMARVARAAAAVLAREGRLSYPLLLIELGVLIRKDFEAWRAGGVPFLEQVVHTNLTKLARIQTAVRRFARARGLQRQAARPPRGRRYSQSGHPSVEAEYTATYRPSAPRAIAARAGVQAAEGGDMPAGRLAEAREVLERAVAMNPADELAAENVRICARDAQSTKTG